MLRLHAKAEAVGARCLDTEWCGEKALYRFACPCGHEWYHDQSWIRCPKCTKQALMLDKRLGDGLQRLQQQARSRGGECLSPAYLGRAARHGFRCARGHEWEIRAGDVLSGSWCRTCSHDSKRLENRSTEKDLARLKAAAAAHGGACLDGAYLGVAHRYGFRCAEGHTWRTPGKLVLGGSWCRRCAVKKSMQMHRRPDALQRLRELAAARGGECLSTEYHGLNHLVRLRCAKGHEWETKAAGPLSGKWCRFCQADAMRLSIEHAREWARRRGGACLSETYVNGQTPMRWQCDRGHEWQVKFASIRAFDTWCPECAHKAQISARHSKARKRYEPAGVALDPYARAPS